jgi:hypothetical protein
MFASSYVLDRPVFDVVSRDGRTLKDVTSLSSHSTRESTMDGPGSDTKMLGDRA